MGSVDPEKRRKGQEELADYDPDDLYDLLSKRYDDLVEAQKLIEGGILGLQSTKEGDVPVSIEDLLQFVRRLMVDINVLYLSNMALISQFKKHNWMLPPAPEE
jgi:hypothetical protein